MVSEPDDQPTDSDSSSSITNNNSGKTSSQPQHTSQQNIFSKTALDSFKNFNQLDNVIQITHPYSWISLLTITVVLLIAVIWVFVGTIPIRIFGTGVLVASGGSVYTAAAPDQASQITKILVKQGDVVTAGQELATLQSPVLRDQLQVAKEYLNNLEKEKVALIATANKSISNYQQQILMQNQRLQEIITTATTTLASSDELIQTIKQAYEKGIETKYRLVAAEQERQQEKNQLEQAKVQLQQNTLNETGYIDQWQERIRELNLRVIEQSKQVEELNSRLQLSEKVVSPVAGQVIGVLHNIGDTVSQGVPLFSITPSAKELDALIFIPAAEGKKVQPGMKVMVLPSTIRKNEYGNIEGQVVDVTAYPSAPESIIALLQNQTLLKKFSNDEPQVIARVQLLTDTATFSGFKWTSSKGPEEQITAGTLVEGKITVEQQHPIDLIIPAIKNLFKE